jgi:hypothetical protein
MDERNCWIDRKTSSFFLTALPGQLKKTRIITSLLLYDIPNNQSEHATECVMFAKKGTMDGY